MIAHERLYEMLYEEYTTNELLNQNYTFDEVLELYEEWKKTAKGLKSDFDKFYGGGIVD